MCSPLTELHSETTSVAQRGAVLLTLLVLVTILGLATGLAGNSWRNTMQQAREAELLWSGQQYQQAIASYYAVKHGSQQIYPSELKHLLRDPRFPYIVRHLRKLYPDPMTGEDWELVRDPAERIIGVRSSSELTPFKQDGFPKKLAGLQGKSAYREWEFVFNPPSEKKAETAPGTAPQQPASPPTRSEP